MSHSASAGRFDHGEILPPDPDLANPGMPNPEMPNPDMPNLDMEVLHDREYRVRAFRKDPNILIRGAVRDQKPPGLYFADDPNPLTIHHMQVDIEVAFPSLSIVAARVVFEVHPNDECPVVTTHYENLVGLSIARGFTHKVRELFGGPRGCTHTTALLQAMAPVAVQCFWSMSASDARRATGIGDDPSPTREELERQWRMNLNSCHIWAEGGEMVAAVQAGTPVPPPRFARQRLTELGLDEDDWRHSMRGV